MFSIHLVRHVQPFVGQNFGAGDFKRCKKTLKLSLFESGTALGIVVVLILFFGKSLIAVFDSNPDVIEIGYVRLMIIMISHIFTLLYEVMSGYLRGFGISLAPAVFNDAGRMRRSYRMDSVCFPTQQNL